MFKSTQITKGQAEKLLSGEAVQFNKLYSEKSGKHFAGLLSIQVNPEAPRGFQLALSFERNEALCPCPRCQSDIVESVKLFKCTNDNCKFVLWKTFSKPAMFSKLTITAPMAMRMINGEHIATGKLYSEKKGKTFNGQIFLDDSERSDWGPKLCMELVK